MTWGDDVMTVLMGTLPDAELERHGADGLAVVSAVCAAADPRAEAHPDVLGIFATAGTVRSEVYEVEIAKRHILPKLTKDHGLTPEEFVVPEEAIRGLIR